VNLRHPLIELDFPESLTQQGLANRPQPISSSRGLRFPTALTGCKGPLTAGVACPLRSALRVWLPSRRLTPFAPAPVLFHTSSALGIHPSELSPVERYPAVSGRKNPPTVSSLCIPCALQCGAGWRDRSFWALTLSRVPDEPNVFSTRFAGCSPGFMPPEACHDDLGRDFAQPPLTRFRRQLTMPSRRPSVSIGLRVCSSIPHGEPSGRGEATSSGFLHHLLPDHSDENHPGYWIHLADGIHLTMNLARLFG
jgi:hypothetical protein